MLNGKQQGIHTIEFHKQCSVGSVLVEANLQLNWDDDSWVITDDAGQHFPLESVNPTP